MGFWDKIADFTYEDSYENRRHEVSPVIQDVTGQALVLARKKQLTPEAMGELAGWDREVLAWIGRKRGALLPGGPKERKAISKSARRALEMVVEARAGDYSSMPEKSKKKSTAGKGKAPKMTREPYSPAQNNEALWEKRSKELAKSLRSLDDYDFVIVGPASDQDRYVRFVRRAEVLFGECPGAVVDGGSLELSPQQQSDLLDMGWGPPDLGPSDYPNYRAVWRPAEPVTRPVEFLSEEDAREAAQFAIDTLRGPLGVTHASDVEVRTE